MLIPTLALTLLMAPADRADPEPKSKAPPAADVRGTVTSLVGLRAQGLVGRILVEGDKEKDTQYDKASVTLTSKTKFYRWEGGKKKDAKFSDLKKGARVQCTFAGGVDESNPVQAKASEVLILTAGT